MAIPITFLGKMIEVEVEVVGGGLVGSLLAWRLAQRGQRVRLWDVPLPGAASAVAPGIINPLAGKNLRPSAGLAEELAEALEIYRQLSRDSHQSQPLFHHVPILRLFDGLGQQAAWVRAREHPETTNFIAQELPPGDFIDGLAAPWGGVVTAGGGWLDVPATLSALRVIFSRGALRPGGGSVEVVEQLWPPDFAAEDREPATPLSGAAPLIVLADGWRSAHRLGLASLPWQPARGQMLTIEGRSQAVLPPQWAAAIINWGKWLVPLGHQRFRLGATYEWADFEGPPTEPAAEALLAQLRQWVPGTWRVLDRQAGTRPVVADRHPVLGWVPLRALLTPDGGEPGATAPHQSLPAHRVSSLDGKDLSRPGRQPSEPSPKCSTSVQAVGGSSQVVSDSFPTVADATRLAICNGFGSKAALHAPRLTRLLTEHLLDGQPLPRHVDVARFSKVHSTPR